jgi:glycosyltransferase involved in cell wall biosynthesis/Flp pilus assembly protein TadD
MTLRYLFGPVNAFFADQFLQVHRKRGDCLAFDVKAGSDLTIGLGDSWNDVCSRLPTGWQPDFVALYLPYRTIPWCLWSAPLPLVGLAGDWNLLWHYERRCLSLCERVLIDTFGLEVLQRQGMTHGHAANIFGCERAYLEAPSAAAERDIDVLFVGNFQPAVQRERLSWLGRVAALADHRCVVLTTNVYHDDYRALLARARIAFNRSISGACNSRAVEAAAMGALLFQEAENNEVSGYFKDREEYVAYRPDDLEELLEYYLDHEDERRAIAGAGQRRAQEYGFATLWQKALDQLEADLPALAQRSRRPPTAEEMLLQRTWQALHSTPGADPALANDLRQALQERPHSAALHNARAVSLAHAAPKQGDDWKGVVAALQQALHHEPLHVVARLNLAEVLLAAGKGKEAVEQARHTLALVEHLPALSADVLDAPHLPAEFDHFRVEWERAAWSHAGQPVEEAKAKRQLLRWRLHALLASLTGSLAHYYEAALTRPDLPATQASFGCALARAGQLDEAVGPLRRAVAGNPFDLPAAVALYHVLGDTAAWPQQHELARQYRWLRQAAPTLVPERDWFAPPPVGAPAVANIAELGPVVWEGDFQSLHSLALVNRELCQRLVERGCSLTLRSTTQLGAATPTLPLPATLAEAMERRPEGPAAVHVRHQWPPDWTPPPDGHWVVMQPWEFGSLPRAWIEPLKCQVDEVWVPSSYVRDCFIKSGVPADRVQVVPNGVDVNLLQSKQPPFPLRTSKRFKFLFVGGTIQRKGIDVLLRAYGEAFSRADDVCLVIKDMGRASFYQGQTAEQLIANCSAEPLPEIEYIARELSVAEMAGLYQSCDCLVHPYRGEGFGLPIAEAMACGLPVIVTGHGAALDFCDETRAFLLPARLGRFNAKRIDRLETVDAPWLAEPDGEMLRYWLRYVVEHPNEARTRGEAAAAYVRRHLSWDCMADAVFLRLQQLRQKPVRRWPCSSGTAGQRMSLCMIVKNEERHLARCLASVVDLVDEIIVIDTGSTDRTKEIALQYGAKVIDFAWVDSFAAARNESIHHATGDWIFWLDADEVLDEVNRQKLRRLFAELPDANLAYVMRQFSTLEVGPHAAAQVDQVRLFRNRPDVRWQYRVHEQILLSVRRSDGDVVHTDIVINHVGFSEAELQGSKVERNLRLLELELAEHPDDSFVLYNLGAVKLTQQKTAEALDLLCRSLACAHPGDVLVRKLHALIVRARSELGQAAEALAACRTGLAAYPDDGELLFRQALLLHQQKDLTGAAACLERILQVRPPEHFTSVDAGLYGYRTRGFLAEVYHDQGRLDDAEAQWQAALAECPSLTSARLELARLYLQQQRWTELFAALPHLDGNAETALEALMLRGRAHLARREFDAAREHVQAAIARAPQAVVPRVLLSHVLLQQDRDWAAAEQALFDVLALDPNDSEAQHNLRVLHQQRRLSGSSLDADTLPAASAPVGACTVSVCLIVRNEEHNLPGCLQSVAGLGAEIIVVDTGSTDRTKEIAQSHGAMVFDFPWVDSFSAARNESLRHASGQWIFWLDADDRLDEQNRNRLRALFASLKDENAAYVMKCLCLPDAAGTATVVDHLRLFRNRPDVHWRFRVHEQILPALREVGTDVRWSDVVIHHTGYQDPALRGRKLERDLRLLQLELAEQPEHPFTLFNLGSVYKEMGKTREALEMLERSLELSAPGDSIVRKLYAMMAQCHLALGEDGAALTVCRNARGVCGHDVELLFQEGLILRRLGDAAGAIACWQECLRLPPAAHFASVNPGLHGHVTRHYLAEACAELGRLGEAEAYFRAALAERPYHEPAWRGLMALLVKQQRWADLEALADKLQTGPDGPLHGAVVRGRALLGRRQFEAARRLLQQTVERYPEALDPRVVLSYVWLQEGQDWKAAEQALQGVLRLDPAHAEARHNLAVLHHQTGQSKAG